MAAGKGGRKKGGGRSRIILALLLLGLLVVTLAAVFVLLFLRPFEKRPVAAGAVKVETPAARSAETAPPAAAGVAGRQLPLLAIVIDDMGYQPRIDEELLRLDLDLSFAFLPYGPHTVDQAALAGRLGRDILLHVPMEPRESGEGLGPGALTLAMGPAERAAVFAEDLARVGQAVGVNNHMGSRFTADRAAMRDFLAGVRERHLFFLDSVTAGDSLGYELAGELGVKRGRRQVFIDNVRETGQIVARIRELLAVAEHQGQAVGIGHPSPETLAALRTAGPEIEGRARLVGVSRLMH